MIDQIVDLSHPLREHGIEEVHCCALAQSYYRYTFDYARAITNVYFSAALGLAVVTYATAVHHVDGKKVLKEDCRMVMLDGHHRRLLMKTVKDEDHLMWTAGPLLMQCAFYLDRKLITPAQAINLSKIVNISTAIVR